MRCCKMSVFAAQIIISEKHWSIDDFIHAKTHLICYPYESSNCISQKKNWTIPQLQAEILSGFFHILYDFCRQLIMLYH